MVSEVGSTAGISRSRRRRQNWIVVTLSTGNRAGRRWDTSARNDKVECAMNPSTIAAPQPPLSRFARLKLSIHRALDKHLSSLGVWVMRRSKGGVAKAWKVNAVPLTTRGRKSGRERAVVLQNFPDGDAMVVVAANDGGAAPPAWYLNLSSSPDAVVEVSGRRIPVHAPELEGDEGAKWWQRILAAAPAYGLYRRATTRRFPILRLVPRRA
jgi:deazaflavin-dependent oxidoreductase (nitroreductase family)